MAGKEWGEMLRHTDGPDAGAASTVRTAGQLVHETYAEGVYLHSESLMKIEVANVTTTNSGIRETNLRVEICAIKVYLATILVDNVTSVTDNLFKHPKCRRVCYLVNMSTLCHEKRSQLTMKAAR